MILGTPEGEINVDKNSLHIVDYPNDLLNGMLIDMPDTYGFISEHDDSRIHIIHEAMEDGSPYYDLSECDPDMSEAPHSWCIRGLERVIVEAAEELCQEAAE